MSRIVLRCPRCDGALPSDPARAGFCPTCNSYFPPRSAVKKPLPAARGPAAPTPVRPAPDAPLPSPEATASPEPTAEEAPRDAVAARGWLDALVGAISEPVPARRKVERVFWLALGGAWLAFALWSAAWFGSHTLDYARSASWTPVAAVVEESREIGLAPGESGAGPFARYRLRYAYRSDGRPVRDGRLYFFDPAGGDALVSSLAECEKLAAKYPPGARVTVYVDPRRPERAVAERAIGLSIVPGLFGLMALVGVAGLLGQRLACAFGLNRASRETTGDARGA